MADCRDADQWEDLDLLETPHITFTGQAGGKLVFAAVQADLDVRYCLRDGAACAEFSWEGSDDDTHASGRGWAALGTTDRLVGHIFIDKGDYFRVRRRARVTPATAYQASRSNFRACPPADRAISSRMASVYALVVAAGRGTRFGGALPKQYLTRRGHPAAACGRGVCGASAGR